ncbi:MAG: endonuclease [Bacteroidales bacterium]|nr:endonuclease [Bacteroidales bacterium]
MFLWWVVSGAILTAQIPEGYYASSHGLAGGNLKTALYNIIKGHTEYPYSSSSTDVWDILKKTDRDTANPDNIILFYTGWSVNAAQEYNGGSGWNREHIWAKSRGDFGTAKGPGTDVHHLRPADISVNSARNNRWFDNCSEPYYDNGVITGCYTSSTDWVWEPRKEVKGDVSRMIFYMATRYEGENGEPDLEMIDYLPADNRTKEAIHAKLSTLLKWNEEDPVDNLERHRNEVVYSYQHNRNPFIDHPEFAVSIWGYPSVVTFSSEKIPVAVYPNPAKNHIYVDKPTNYTVSLLNMTGTEIMNTKENHFQLNSSVVSGIYILIIEDPSGNKVVTRKLVVRK